MNKLRALGISLFLVMAGSQLSASTILSEGFVDITTLAGNGWVVVNNSSPVGASDWFQGNTAVFDAQNAADDSYVATNFYAAAFGGVVDNWLLTPEIALSNTMFVTFYTRTETGAPYADQLEVAVSQSGSSTDVVNDFTTILQINPGLTVPGYPESWTMFKIDLSMIGAPTTGRLAFHYALPDNVNYADYVGIDTLSVVQTPEPASLALMAAGLGALALIRSRRNTK